MKSPLGQSHPLSWAFGRPLVISGELGGRGKSPESIEGEEVEMAPTHPRENSHGVVGESWLNREVAKKVG